MLVINRNSSNEIIISVSENQTISNPNYLFVFTSHTTFASTSCIASGDSTYSDRYTSFNITENDSPDRLNNEIHLRPNGTYSYSVYAQTSSTNLIGGAAEELLEEGLANIKGEEETINEYNTSPDTNNYYDGE